MCDYYLGAVHLCRNLKFQLHRMKAKRGAMRPINIHYVYDKPKLKKFSYNKFPSWEVFLIT